MSQRFRAGERFASFRFAWQGLRAMLANEHNSRIHLAWTAAVILLGLAVGLTLDEWRWVLIAAALVWVTEAINSAIERLGDAITLERDLKIGEAKDVAAASVLIAGVASALIGVSVFGPYLLDWLKA